MVTRASPPHTAAAAAAHLDPQVAQQALLLVVVDALLAQLILLIIGASSSSSRCGPVRTHRDRRGSGGGGGGKAHGGWTLAIGSLNAQITPLAVAHQEGQRGEGRATPCSLCTRRPGSPLTSIKRLSSLAMLMQAQGA